MKCLICRQAESTDSLMSITFARDEFKMVINNVPARICPSCGEAYVEEAVALNLLREAEREFAQGVREATCEYVRD